jgi:hypothetical protein
LPKLPVDQWRLAVPVALRTLPRWVGHIDKKPCDPRDGSPASTTDPKTWGDFEDAFTFYAQHWSNPAAGVGFVFVPEDGFVFLDLDHCLDEAGKAKPWARRLVQTLGEASYMERSPSGTGLHVFLQGALPRAEGSSGGWIQLGETKEEKLEAYAERRYSTVTGDRVSRFLTVKEAHDALDTVLKGTGLGEKLLRSAPAASSDAGEEPERAAEIAAALSHLDPDVTYADWTAVGMALRTGLGDEAGLPLWVAWSSQGGKYVPGEPEEKWQTFQRGAGSQRVGLGTLIKMAEAGGWTPPWLERPGALEEFKDFDPPPCDPDDVPYHMEAVGKAVVYVRGPENVRLFFERSKTWRGRLRWNLREDAPELDGRQLRDADLVDLSGAISRAFGWSPAVGKDPLRDGLYRAAHADEYDPVQEWLQAQRWDGVPRLDALCASVGLEDNPATRRYLRRWMIGAVARVYRPGCEMQNMLVLVGPQGAGKSRLFKRLAVRPEWYRESEVKLADKDGQLAVLAPWIVEVGELAGMTRAEVDRVKVFVSESESRFRRPYGTLDERHPRRCVFAGTTNEEEFQRDPTGARRFWSVALTRELVLPSPEIVALLWGEARAAYEAGERWYEDAAELAETLGRGAERFAETTLDVHVERLAGELESKGATTMAEVVTLLGERHALNGGNAPTSSIAHALKRAGWILSRTRMDGKMRRIWRLAEAGREAQVLAFRRSAGYTPSGDGSGDGSSGDPSPPNPTDLL